LKAAGSSDMERFRIAVRHAWRYTDIENRTIDDPRGRGLVLEGLRVLQKINPAGLSDEEKTERNYFLIRLNCFQGKIQEAVEIYNHAKQDLGNYNIECTAWIAAATGWYKNLDEALGVMEADIVEHLARQTPNVIDLAVSSLGLNHLIDMPTAARIGHGVFAEHLLLIQREKLNEPAAMLADYRTLRGLYASNAATSSALLPISTRRSPATFLFTTSRSRCAIANSFGKKRASDASSHVAEECSRLPSPPGTPAERSVASDLRFGAFRLSFARSLPYLDVARTFS